MVPSSSGPGRLVLIQKIKGSTPFGITILKLKLPIWAFFLAQDYRWFTRTLVLIKKMPAAAGEVDELFEIGGVIFEEFSNLDCGIEAFEMVVGMTAFTHR